MARDSLRIQGQSDSTEAKERGLQAVFSTNLGIVKAKLKDHYPYWHFDLNCGSGKNAIVGCDGSPLAFLHAARARGVKHYIACFCDREADHLAALQALPEVAGNARAFLFHGDNASLVDAIPDLIKHSPYPDRPEKAMGMVFSDPNGDDVPLDELARLSVACPRLDIAIHWNTRLRKLRRAHGHSIHDIEDAIAMLGKAHWLIRKPLGSWSWTVLIGRNFRVGDHLGMGYVHLESPAGQAILNNCKAGDPVARPPRKRFSDLQLEMAL